MHRDRLHRTFRFAGRLFAFAPRSLDKNLPVSRINIRPLQSETLFGPKCCSRVDKCCRPLKPSLRSVELFQDCDHLFGADDFRFVIGLGLTTNPAKFWRAKGIGIHADGNQLMSLSMGKYLAHD